MKKTLLFAPLTVLMTLAAPLAHAGLIGSVTITELYPSSTTEYSGGQDTVAVGGSLSCPGSSPLCASDYFAAAATFSVTATTISLTEQCCAPYGSAAFNGYEFSGLTFADSGNVMSATITSSNMTGVSNGDITINSFFDVFVNLEGGSEGSGTSPGIFTLTLSETAAAVPEPSFFLPLGAALAGLGVLARRRQA